MTASFECVTHVDAPVSRVFDLSLSIDAHLGSMERSNEQAVGGVTSGVIGLGEEVTWRARHFGVWWTMTSRITELEPQRRFVDEQVRGPFARFRHEHLFADREGLTVMTDRVDFAAPLGPLGRLAESAYLSRYLRRLIEERNIFLKAAAEDD